MKNPSVGGGLDSSPAARARNKSESEAIPPTGEKQAGSGVCEAENSSDFDAQSAQKYLREWRGAAQTSGEVMPGIQGRVGHVVPTHEMAATTRPDQRVPNDYLSPPTRTPTPDERPLRLTFEPPVTKATLSELDSNKITHNPKLRHDINFDPDLHFRPNLEGEKGKKKRDKADQFWATLHGQLVRFATDRDAFLQSLHGEEWCLPLLLKAVKDIICTLVPNRDKEFVSDGLNVDLLMQQFNRGVADLEKLAQWLSGVLKRHCAPMRDEWVDRMYLRLSRGNRDNNVDELVTGLRELLSVLEAMKLDVANHQIRCLRPVLIHSTVHFEQSFFRKKIQANKISVDQARAWYNEGCHEIAASPQRTQLVQAFGETAAFFHSLVKLVLPSAQCDGEPGLPSTFLFDEERIAKLRSDLYDCICLEICMQKFEDLNKLSRIAQACLSGYPVGSGGGSGSGRNSIRNSYVGEFNFNSPPTSRPGSFTLSEPGSECFSQPNSSRPSSGLLFLQPLQDPVQSQAKSSSLYDSLVALLQTAPLSTPLAGPEQRWQDLSQSVALQILRYVEAPHHLSGSLTSFEDRLEADLCDAQSDVFKRVEHDFRQRLMVSLAKRAHEFKNLTLVDTFSLATGGRINALRRTPDWKRDRVPRDAGGLVGAGCDSRKLGENGRIDDLAIRLAHLGTLHWRVWALMAYVPSETDDPLQPH